MAKIKQLELVVKIETEKEQHLARQYQLAKQNAFDNQQKLNSLEQYRVDYIALIKQKAEQGVSARALIQHQSFVGKLDKACEQQVEMINQCHLVSEQRKQQWIAQQTRTKAIHLLLNKQKSKKTQLENKQEQRLFDELSAQSHIKSINSVL